VVATLSSSPKGWRSRWMMSKIIVWWTRICVEKCKASVMLRFFKVSVDFPGCQASTSVSTCRS
jgi:hypothetical protein